MRILKLKAYELENLLEVETHDITCDDPAPHTGSGANFVDAAFPFSNAVGTESNNQNPSHSLATSKFWKMKQGFAAAGTFCWLVLKKPFYIPEVLIFGSTRQDQHIQLSFDYNYNAAGPQTLHHVDLPLPALNPLGKVLLTAPHRLVKAIRITNVLPVSDLELAGITLLSHFEHSLTKKSYKTNTTNEIEYINMKPGSVFTVKSQNDLVLTPTITVVTSTKVKLTVVIPNGTASVCVDGTGGKTCVIEL